MRILQTKWSVKESRALIELYKQNKSNVEISKILNRTRHSVAYKLYSFGLHRPKGTNQVNFGMKNPMQGEKHSDTTIKKIREKAIKRFKNKVNHPRWKGGVTINHNGYICVKNSEHYRSRNGYVFEHILVMENMLGRLLKTTEVVHHINMKKTDNRPENLMLFQNSTDHKRYHAFMRKKEVFGV